MLDPVPTFESPFARTPVRATFAASGHGWTMPGPATVSVPLRFIAAGSPLPPGTRLEKLAETFAAAVLDQPTVNSQLAAAQAALDATNAKAGGARTQLQAEAITEYVNGMSMADLAAPAAGGDPLLKAQYARTLAATETDALDGMRAVALELMERQAALSAAQKAAATTAAVKQDQVDAAKAQSDLQSTLGRSKVTSSSWWRNNRRPRNGPPAGCAGGCLPAHQGCWPDFSTCHSFPGCALPSSPPKD